MPEVLIRCPVTHKLLSTGIALDLECFHRADLREMSTYCPFCARHHPWQKEDAFLQRE
jgi:hypothetical protein